MESILVDALAEEAMRSADPAATGGAAADQHLDADADALTLEDTVGYPLPGFVNPGSLQFSPDDALISNLHSPEGTLARKLFVFDPAAMQQRLLAVPPRGGGVDEARLSVEEKLQRERTRELGLGVTRYAWAAKPP
eukprot:CAMPEP_0197596388 /NCGR_PEP_ID=MMETSP1326-20131121/24943_1 /TAXON_ID=1155430 /ORGANISM="Genus nov. species nov., Strain RCC2288" /LENGTH=135 /DNA_ID=CAMNT_0043162873 /DNA_START=173 /DNA_END=576 /DNA_ORIENTATION=+